MRTCSATEQWYCVYLFVLFESNSKTSKHTRNACCVWMFHWNHSFSEIGSSVCVCVVYWYLCVCQCVF